jgi:2-haloacid dehalogenase
MSEGVLAKVGDLFRSRPGRPQAIAFDVIGTLFPLEPLRAGVIALGLPAAGLEGWFAAGCRDAFALASVGQFEPFATVLESALDTVLAEQGLTASSAERKELIEGLQALDARQGANEALARLDDAQIPAIALSNGSRLTTAALLGRAGLEHQIAHIVTVETPKQFKPRAEVYRLAADAVGVAPGALALVAAHGWDINGAHAAGLTTAYLSADRPYPAVMHAPDVEADSLPACVTALLEL